MHIVRPKWLTHGGEKKDFEVYSCHVSPDGKRLVTAAGDGHVRVWSTEAIYDAAKGKDTSPKQLSSMSHHSGTIHAVRFSGNGKYLASGADDRVVCIYNLDPNPPTHNTTFGTDEAPPIENWRIFRRLIGHENDVQDLGWSYDSSILVSVGLDSKVVVWSGYTFEKLKTLSNHQSHVKGVTFDPANKYFATASDDRTVRIFRFTPPGPNSTAQDQISNFVLEKTISMPFTASPLTTYFRRCSWSPEGNHIAAANAVNGPVSSVVIINRGTWDSDIHLIGHEGPVEVCAFSPRLFTRGRPGQAIEGQSLPHAVTVIACAGQDKALTIWVTSNSRPLVITQDLALKAISDLAWSPDGTNLFATSLDGSIVALMFEEGELGYPTDMEVNTKALAKYGGGRRGAGIIESPAGLLLEDQSKAGEMRGVEGRMGALMGDSSAPSPQQPLSTGNANGAHPKSNHVNGDSNYGDNTSGDINDRSKANGDGRPNGDGRVNDDSTVNGSGKINGITEDTPMEDANAGGEDSKPESKDSHTEKLERLRNRMTITKDGKRRITPLLVSTSNVGESSLPHSRLMASSDRPGGSNDTPQTTLDLSKPFDGLPKGGIAALLLGNREKLISDGDEERPAESSKNGEIPILITTAAGHVPASSMPSVVGQIPTPEFIRPAVLNPSLSISQVRLAVPKVRAQIMQTFGDATTVEGLNEAILTSASTMFEAWNPPDVPPGRPDDREPVRLGLTRRGTLLWQDFLPKSVLLMAGAQRFWAVACDDGSIYAWTPAGRRLINAMVLESQPVILESKDSRLLCITAAGLCYVWDLSTLSSPHPPVSLAPVLDAAIHSLQDRPTKAPAITSAHLNSEGRIFVTLSNGDGYAYSPTMFVWQRLTEVWWAVGSQYWNTIYSSVGNITAANGTLSTSNLSAGVIPFLERQTTNETLVRGRAYFLQRMVKQLLNRDGYESFESSVSLAHLENRVAAALMLGAKDEFQLYLYMYTRRLGAESLKSKIEELLRSLVGEDFGGLLAVEGDPSEDRTWDGDGALCGWPRQELLKAIVLILGKHRDLQRIVLPYAKILQRLTLGPLPELDHLGGTNVETMEL